MLMGREVVVLCALAQPALPKLSQRSPSESVLPQPASESGIPNRPMILQLASDESVIPNRPVIPQLARDPPVGQRALALAACQHIIQLPSLAFLPCAPRAQR
ncbi:unnamed protein product [Boreogadus saida]